MEYGMGWDITEFESVDDYGHLVDRYLLTRDGEPMWATNNYGDALLVHRDRVPSSWVPTDLKPNGRLLNGRVSFWCPLFVTGEFTPVFVDGKPDRNVSPFKPNLGGDRDWVGLAAVYEEFSTTESVVPVEVSPRAFSFKRNTTYGTAVFLPNGGVGAVYRNVNGKGQLKADYLSSPEIMVHRHFADANVRSVFAELGVAEAVG